MKFTTNKDKQRMSANKTVVQQKQALTKEHRVDSQISSCSIQLPISSELHLSMTAVCADIDAQCCHLKIFL